MFVYEFICLITEKDYHVYSPPVESVNQDSLGKSNGNQMNYRLVVGVIKGMGNEEKAIYVFELVSLHQHLWLEGRKERKKKR